MKINKIYNQCNTKFKITKIFIKIIIIFKINYKIKKSSQVHHKETHYLKKRNSIFIIKTF